MQLCPALISAIEVNQDISKNQRQTHIKACLSYSYTSALALLGTTARDKVLARVDVCPDAARLF